MLHTAMVVHSSLGLEAPMHHVRAFVKAVYVDPLYKDMSEISLYSGHCDQLSPVILKS